ncbi:MAG: hypothetical protein PVG03_07745 [Desulfarculaceae bacterium]|jgi:hypothetical protein
MKPDQPVAPRLLWELCSWQALALAALVGLCFAPALLEDKIYLIGDLKDYNFPVKYLYAQTLEQDHFLFWSSRFGFGHYLHGVGQGGFAHPLNLVLFGLLPLNLAFTLSQAFYMLGAAWGMYLWCRSENIGRNAGDIAGLAFCLSGFFTTHFSHFHLLAVAAHLPWGLALLRNARNRSSLWSLGWLGLATASAALLGHPQMLFICLLVWGFYALWLAALWEWARAVKMLAVALLAVVMGLFIAGVQLGPTLAHMADSHRFLKASSGGENFSQIYSLHSRMLLTYVSPYLFGVQLPGMPGNFQEIAESNFWEETVFTGVSVLFLAGLGWAGTLRSRPLWAGFWIVFGIVALLLALGKFGPLAPVLDWPGFDLFRVPARYTLVTTLVLCLGLGLGLERLGEGSCRLCRRWLGSRRRLIVVSAVVLAAGAVYFATAPVLDQPLKTDSTSLDAAYSVERAILLVEQELRDWQGRSPKFSDQDQLHELAQTRARQNLSNFRNLGVGLCGAILGLGGLLLCFRLPQAGWRLVAITALMLAELGLFAWSYSYSRYSDPPAIEPKRQAAVVILGRHLIETEPPRTFPKPNRVLFTGLRYFPPYDVLRSQEVDEVEHYLLMARPEKWPQISSSFCRRAGINWVVTGNGGPSQLHLVSAKIRRAYLNHDVAVLPWKEILPRLFEPDCTQTFIPAPAQLDINPSVNGGGVVTVEKWEDGHIGLSVSSPAPQMLVVLENFHPGWQARVNGREARLYKADGLFLGLLVPSGAARVDLRFDPPGMLLGGIATGLGLLGAAIWALLFVRLRRRLKVPDPEPEEQPSEQE